MINFIVIDLKNGKIVEDQDKYYIDNSGNLMFDNYGLPNNAPENYKAIKCTTIEDVLVFVGQIVIESGFGEHIVDLGWFNFEYDCGGKLLKQEIYGFHLIDKNGERFPISRSDVSTMGFSERNIFCC